MPLTWTKRAETLTSNGSVDQETFRTSVQSWISVLSGFNYKEFYTISLDIDNGKMNGVGEMLGLMVCPITYTDF
jgi:hypothetical protein